MEKNITFPGIRPCMNKKTGINAIWKKPNQFMSITIPDEY